MKSYLRNFERILLLGIELTAFRNLPFGTLIETVFRYGFVLSLYCIEQAFSS